MGIQKKDTTSFETVINDYDEILLRKKEELEQYKSRLDTHPKKLPSDRKTKVLMKRRYKQLKRKIAHHVTPKISKVFFGVTALPLGSLRAARNEGLKYKAVLINSRLNRLIKHLGSEIYDLDQTGISSVMHHDNVTAALARIDNLREELLNIKQMVLNSGKPQ
ncbi:MAG: hypothetical protein HQK83_13075 [Fibrobacteria bacterium]|nr:hypothetical protein [Fibrobacteria bacterium]